MTVKLPAPAGGAAQSAAMVAAVIRSQSEAAGEGGAARRAQLVYLDSIPQLTDEPGPVHAQYAEAQKAMPPHTRCEFLVTGKPSFRRRTV